MRRLVARFRCPCGSRTIVVGRRGKAWVQAHGEDAEAKLALAALAGDVKLRCTCGDLLRRWVDACRFGGELIGKLPKALREAARSYFIRHTDRKIARARRARKVG